MAEEDRTQFYLWLDTLRFPSTVPHLKMALSKARQAPPGRLVLTHLEISQIDMIVQTVKDRCALYDLDLKVQDQSEEP